KRGGRNAVSITVNTPDLVTVVFHVIISDLGNVMDPEKYSVFMRFGPASLGTFQPDVDKHQMEYKEKTNLGYLYEGKVMMTKHQRNSNSFAYKYLVKKKEHGKSKVVWEVVQRRDPGQSYQQLVNRQFSIPLEKRSLTGVWHRYDGVAYLPGALSEGAFSKLRGMLGGSTYKDRVRQDALASARVYLPSVKDIQHSVLKTSPNTVIAENYLDRISQVMSSLRYQMLDPRLDYVDENMVEKAIRENIISPIMEQLKELSHQKKRTVALAMFVLLLVDRFSFLLAPPFVNDLCFYMLVKPDIMHKTCEDMEDLKVHFPDAMKDSRALAEKLCRLVLLSDRDAWKFGSNLSWLCCIPLLHFLLERSHPFQELKPSADFRSDQWMSDEALQILQPAFASDPLFARTLVASLPLKPLLPILLTGLIPVEKVADCVVKMLSLWKEREASDRPLIQQLEKTECQATIVKELFRCLLGRTGYHPQTLLGVAHLLLMMLDTVAVIEEKENLKEKREAPCGWAERAQWVVSATQMLGVMLENLKDIRHEGLRQMLEKLVADNFEKELSKLTDQKKLLVYLEQENVSPALVGMLNTLAFDSLDAAFEASMIVLIFFMLLVLSLGSEQLSESQIVMLISLQSNFLEKKWREKVKNDADVLPFILTWTPMVNYFLRFREKKMSEKLSHIASHNIQYALKFLDDVTAQVRKGNIRISVLRMLIRYQQQFLDIVAATSKARDTVAVTLTQRAHELEAYESAASLLQTLVDFCCNFLQTDDLQHLQRSIQQQQDEAHLQCLSKVCDIANPDDIEDLADYHPRANPWQLTDDVLAVLPDFRDKTFSLVFHNIFSQRAKLLTLTGLSFWRAFHVVWSDVSQEWKAFCKKMVDGSISIQDTEKVFGMFLSETGDYRWHEVREELERIAGDGPKQWVDDRISQFKCYSDVQKHVEAATVLLKVKDTYNIAGTYDDIQKICGLSQQAVMPIRDVDRSLLNLCKRLNDITPQDVACLKGFVHPRCKEFVMWLRDSMKGVKELNVFVDLALISAGDEAWAIGRVNCFHAAATGYAPLIFTEMKSCVQLLQQCPLVFKNVAAHPTLPEKLKTASQHLNWFKNVQKSHGSVEKTSLAQVGNIIDRGVFTNLHSVIQLLVSEETEDESAVTESEDSEHKTPPKVYTYEELLDLQSRLMLVAGQEDKGREKFVDRFITIMDSLLRLGKTYVRLCDDGCVLFLDWTVKFLCDSSRPVCCISQFAEQGQLKGRRGENAALEHFIAGVASFLEECHSDWLQHLNQKRNTYPELNVYTVEQLVFLQKQLVRVSSGDVSELVYPMLSLLKSQCTPDDLEAALGLDWCMKHEKDVEENEEGNNDEEEDVLEERKPGVGERLKEWVTRDKTVTESAIDWLENMKEGQRMGSLTTMTKNLKAMWKNFLENVAFSGADFLSMEHLGMILKCLAARDTRQFNGSLPPSFKPGVPHLILCPTSEVLNAVTYMYMFPEDDKSLLPQPEEVLLCTKDTSFEQVDIFLRQAFFGTEEKVYCLAFADALDYDVGEKTEKKMKEYTSQAGERNYQLVVVCTTENEYRARIVAALEKYRQPAPAFSNTSKVRQYLKARFAGVVTKGGKTSASQRLTARLKRSNLYETRDQAITIPLHCHEADSRDIAARLLPHTLHPAVVLPRIIHLDIPYQVQEGVDHLLYNLLVLGRVTDVHGNVWLRSPMDLYLVETMPLHDQKNQQRGRPLVHQILDVLPCLNCWSPLDSLHIITGDSDAPEELQKKDQPENNTEKLHSVTSSSLTAVTIFVMGWWWCSS
ncbi:hypothetical protein BaRGS_00029877, partial [Batillaria attramentaria]